jgi:hypothetical protein
MLVRPRVVFPIVFALMAASAASAPTKRAMTIDDVIDLVQLSAPRIPAEQNVQRSPEWTLT